MDVKKQIEYRTLLDNVLNVEIAAREVHETVKDFIEVVGKDYVEEFENWVKARVEQATLFKALAGEPKAAKELLSAWYPEKYDAAVRKLMYEERLDKQKGEEFKNMPRLKFVTIEKNDS